MIFCYLLIHPRNTVVTALYYLFLFHVTYNTALTLLSSRLSNGPGGSSRQRNSLTARLFKGKKISWHTNKFTKDSRKQSHIEAIQ